MSYPPQLEPKLIQSFFGEAYDGVGCKFCGGTGFKQRTGIFESLVITPDISELITRDPREESVKNLMKEKGVISLEEDAAEKVRLGMIDPRSALRAISATLLD